MNADDADGQACKDWYDRKQQLIEPALGPMHGTVMHAIIPYAIGGGLDLYYYADKLPGTAVVTMELSEAPGTGSSNDAYGCYELVMFTREPLDLDRAADESTPFGRMHRLMNAVLNRVAPYSAQATLNPNETLEFPADMPTVGGRCLIFDGYTPRGNSEFGLMALIEVFRSEMDFARANGGAKLLARLKRKKYYPYSDLDREPVA